MEVLDHLTFPDRPENVEKTIQNHERAVSEVNGMLAVVQPAGAQLIEKLRKLQAVRCSA